MKRRILLPAVLIATAVIALSGCTDYSEYNSVVPIDKRENVTSNDYVLLAEQSDASDSDKKDDEHKCYLYDGYVRVELKDVTDTEISVMLTNGLETELVSFGMPIAQNEAGSVELNWHGNSLQSVFVVSPHQSLIATYRISPDFAHKGCIISGKVWANVSENENGLTKSYSLTI